MAYAVGDRGVDADLGDIAFGAKIIATEISIFGQQATLNLHFMRRLPGPNDDFANPAHRLRIRSDHREGTQIVKDILGGDGLLTDA